MQEMTVYPSKGHGVNENRYDPQDGYVILHIGSPVQGFLDVVLDDAVAEEASKYFWTVCHSGRDRKSVQIYTSVVRSGRQIRWSLKAFAIGILEIPRGCRIVCMNRDLLDFRQANLVVEHCGGPSMRTSPRQGKVLGLPNGIVAKRQPSGKVSGYGFTVHGAFHYFSVKQHGSEAQALREAIREREKAVQANCMQSVEKGGG